MPFGVEVSLGAGDFVLDGDPAPPRKGQALNFRPMSIVPKRLDGCIRIPLGTEVGLGSVYIVLDDTQLPL